MVVVVALFSQHPAPVPEGRPPAAPVLVGAVGIEDEPASLHLRVPERLTPAACHLLFVEWEVHVLGGVAVQVVDLERTVAVGEVARGKGIGAALGPTSARAPRGLEARGPARPLLILGA